MTEAMKEAADRLNMAMKTALVTFAGELDITETERKHWVDLTAQLKAKEEELAKREKDVKNREESAKDVHQIAATRLLEKKVAQESAEQSNARAKKAEKDLLAVQEEKKRLEAVITTLIKEKADLSARVADLTRACAELEAQVPVKGGADVG